MKEKDISLFERLSDSISDRRLLNRLHVKLSELDDDLNSSFMEFLLDRIPWDELHGVITIFLNLPAAGWEYIAGRRADYPCENEYSTGDIADEDADDPSGSRSGPEACTNLPKGIDPD